MRTIIEARIEDDAGGSEPIRLAEFERADGELAQLGLSLAEGRRLMLDSPQLRVCQCGQGTSESFSPLALALPLRVSPELEYLHVKWAAHLQYAVATTLLKETLPVDQAISTAGLRNRVWAVGQELDDQAESAIRGERAYPPANGKPKIVA